MRRVRARLLIRLVMIELRRPLRRESAAALRCEGVRVASEVRRRGGRSDGGGVAGGSQVRCGTERAGSSCPGGDAFAVEDRRNRMELRPHQYERDVTFPVGGRRNGLWHFADMPIMLGDDRLRGESGLAAS